jgi:hypothetical protein
LQENARAALSFRSPGAANLREQPSKKISQEHWNRLKQLGFFRVAERVGFVTPLYATAERLPGSEKNNADQDGCRLSGAPARKQRRDIKTGSGRGQSRSEKSSRQIRRKQQEREAGAPKRRAGPRPS